MELKDLTSAYTLANGIAIPAVGYGTFRTPATVARQAVKTAIEVATATSTRPPFTKMKRRSAKGLRIPGLTATASF